MKFKPVVESQVYRDINSGTTSTFDKSGYGEQPELLYKVLKADVKMVRALLETHGFERTDGHEWNVLWSCTSLKPYIYEGLKQY